jgi:hypothetical protein
VEGGVPSPLLWSKDSGPAFLTNFLIWLICHYSSDDVKKMGIIHPYEGLAKSGYKPDMKYTWLINFLATH